MAKAVRHTSTRKDKKGRILLKGEYQNPKNGRYEFSMEDKFGHKQKVYSWRLVETDRIPAGTNPDDPCLRVKEAILKGKIDAGLDTQAAKEAKSKTVDDYFEDWLNDEDEESEPRKESTKISKRKHYRNYIKPFIGGMKIQDVTPDDCKKVIRSIFDKGNSDGTAKNINSLLVQIFAIAYNKGAITDNPAEKAYKKAKHDVLKEAKRKGEPKPIKEAEKREALTKEEQADLVEFLRTDTYAKRWRVIILTMLGTGLRVSELCGLTWDCIDFDAKELDNGCIYVTKQLQYRTGLPWEDVQESHYVVVDDAKTAKGTNREVPMRKDLHDILLAEKERQEREGGNTFIVKDVAGREYSGFVFANLKGNPLRVATIDAALKTIVTRINRERKAEADAKGIPYKEFPSVSAHILRHTYCTRRCETCKCEVDVQKVQDAMGHVNIATTLGTYTTVHREEKAKANREFEESDAVFA